jgi:hypothetical protein
MHGGSEVGSLCESEERLCTFVQGGEAVMVTQRADSRQERACSVDGKGRATSAMTRARHIRHEFSMREVV